MRTIAIINLKGGTAKTTTTVNLAAELRHRGKRVLCIDADPQHNLTDFLGASAEGTTITDLLAGRVCEAEIAVQRLGAGFGCVPSDLSLCEIDIEAIQKGISLRTVRDLCEAVADDFDVCLIDCPPSFTAASIAALVAADEVILPVTVDAFAIGGAQEIVQQVENLAGQPGAPCARGARDHVAAHERLHAGRGRRAAARSAGAAHRHPPLLQGAGGDVRPAAAAPVRAARRRRAGL